MYISLNYILLWLPLDLSDVYSCIYTEVLLGSTELSLSSHWLLPNNVTGRIKVLQVSHAARGQQVEYPYYKQPNLNKDSGS